ncbi:MAG: hypothetical protein A2513_03940 [Sulfurimonas sp. RIFOXYD12_FULL_33_39]|uniref:hypothetical protein n=1 Tax=unclassified Sulfurimonas TaxID=2623549 RepID=UPI0008BE9F36|nr:MULTISPECIES: hypothetical protein [unclassified Sulfurimonas]OHE09289.1 MAG: hypothetical protein A2513_03940 [Sulfurimonas sp. RIFOXYD12_FULL_33_39]OHE12928.1 MAG: hypothetical protein A2530_04865 [Sulfurimonas sp. RIFOXYD2_FULL_34_21]
MKLNKTTSALLSYTILFATVAAAKPNLPPPVEDFVKLEKMAGPAGAFTVKENFPKDYFLIPKNLPYLVGLSLYDPSSSTLNLSKEQIDSILKIKQELTSKAAKKALVIKKLELDMMQKISLQYKSPKVTEFYPTVDEIAKLKAELTKIHLDCIEKVKAVLTKEQYEELLEYGVVNMF